MTPKQLDALSNALTSSQRAALEVVLIVRDAIKELGEVPSGHLYARLMGSMSIDDYNAVIKVLKEAKVVEERHHLLTYVGPGAKTKTRSR